MRRRLRSKARILDGQATSKTGIQRILAAAGENISPELVLGKCSCRHQKFCRYHVRSGCAYRQRFLALVNL